MSGQLEPTVAQTSPSLDPVELQAARQIPTEAFGFDPEPGPLARAGQQSPAELGRIDLDSQKS
ncbi:MAG: hypothetical protein V3R89_00905 [Thermoanaerobaculia bacterium]